MPQRSTSASIALRPASSAGDAAQSARTTQDWLDAISRQGGHVITHRCGLQGRAALEIALCSLPEGQFRLPALPLDQLSITLSRVVVSGGVDGSDSRSRRCPRYALTATPAQHGACWYASNPRRQLCIFFDAACHGRGDKGSLSLHAPVPGLRAWIDELVAELEAGPAASVDAIDSLCRLLLTKVMRRQGDPPVSGLLAGEQLQRVRHHVLAHLHERLRVDDLAAVAGMSSSGFARSWTERTGESPHQYVLAQRLQRAQLLLRDRNTPLVNVAADCGFASQQHLCQVMRTRLGVTPLRFRRQFDTGEARL